MLRFQNKVPAAITIGGKIVEKIIIRNEVVWGRVQTPLYIQNTYNGSNTISVKQTLSGSPDSSVYAKHLQYSKDGLNWTTITLSSTAYTISLAKNEKVYFRGNEGVLNYWTSEGANQAITNITGTQTHTVGGNINSLIDYTDPYGLTLPQGAFNGLFENDTKLTSASDITLPPSADGSISTYCYMYIFKGCSGLTTAPQSIPATTQGQDACHGMFLNCTALTTAPALPATTLAYGCYWGMFSDCTALTTAPALPATTMAESCYRLMFKNTAITTPPALPATTLAEHCYRGMFENTAITTAPALPATTLATSCYWGMFKNTAITTAPALPATTLAESCYYEMFYGCTALTSAPALPAMTLTTSCYNKMFYGCSSLVNAPALPATVLANQCYQQMFRYCTALTSAPSTLPATTAPYMCCQRMFSDCTALTSVPTLPATTVGSGCYQYMFFGCTSLTTAQSELPATTLTLNCYYEMFRGCSNLTSAPRLKATTLAENSCRGMFYSCTSLNSLSVYADDNSAEKCTDKWLYGVASSGILNNYGSATYTTNSESGIPTGWTENRDYFYIENTSNSANNIYLKTNAGYTGTEPTGEFATSIEYSKDKKTWTSVNLNYKYSGRSSSTITNLTLSLAKNEKVYFRNTSGYFSYVNDIDMATNNWGKHRHSFSSDNNIKVGGNIKSLLDYRDMSGTTLKKGCFYGLFYGAENLTDASKLTLGDTVAENCYMMMFENCYSLTSKPVLPATVLAPRCYYEMFKNTAITSAPVLRATTLAPYCYKNMFESCTSLTYAPELPATTLSTGCYQGMFNGCSYLTSAPVLRATTLAEYSYRFMFMGCSRLNSVTTYANDISANECTKWWLDNVASTGIVHNFGSATYTTGSTSGIPTHWTELKNS